MGLSEIAGKLVEPARWIIIMGIAFTLANTVLFFIAPPEQAGATAAAARQTTRSPDTRSAVSINAILNRNLFGEAGESVVDTGLPAVETRLPLELLGVFVADEASDSAAIVAQKNKAGLLFVVGEKVPGNAELLEVHADHIVLRRAGNREILRFEEATSSAPVAMQTSRSDLAADEATESLAAPAEMPETPRDYVASYRERIDADPEGTLKEIGITPVSQGDAQGYRLDGAAASSPYLSQTGLQPGDVVLSVNGQPVGNIQQDRHQLDNILAEGSARIEVQRGTRRFFVTASLKQ